VGESRIATKSNKEIAGKTEGNLSFETEHQYWYHSDHLGSAQLTTTRSGELHERIEYTPYGEIWVEHRYDPAEGSLPYRFTGKELDEETGYYYYGARYLDPKTSRWISTDPAVGEYIPPARQGGGGLPGMGGVFNLVNLHVYHYAGNNPVKYIDPDGNFFGIDDAIGAIIQCRDDDWNRFGERFKSNFTNSWKLIWNTFNTFHDIHNFKDFVNSTIQFVGRFTWGILGTICGFLSGYGAIEGFGGQYSRFKNLSMIKTDGYYGAFTIGHVSVGDKSSLDDIVTYAHEYGHYIMSLLLGPLYILHAIASVRHAYKYGPADNGYFEYQTEIEADQMGGVKVEWENGRIKSRSYP
jgi:RHS repeat-associated protein